MRIRSLAILASLFISSIVVADQTVVATPVKVGTKTISLEQLRRISGLYPAPKGANERRREEIERDPIRPVNPASPKGPQWPPAVGTDYDLARILGSTNNIGLNDGGVVGPPIRNKGPLFSLSTSWDGPNLGSSGYIPPDSCGDAGLTSVIVAANGRIRSYNRSGTLTLMNLTADAFFSPLNATFGASTSGLGVSDPRVVFDRLTNRWFMAGIQTSNNSGGMSVGNAVLIAWSSGEDLSSPSTTWTMTGWVPETGTFADYETLGVDANAVYTGTNKFSTTSFVNCNMYAFPKASLLAGSPAVANLGTTLNTTTFQGMYTPQPCTNDDPSATSGVYVGVDGATFGTLYARRIGFTAPSTFSVSGDIALTVTATNLDSGTKARIPSATGTARFASVVDDRLFQARIFADSAGNRSIWTAHNINVDNAGSAVSTATSGTSTNRYGSRWYQLTNPFSGTLTVNQSGTVFDTTSGSTNFNHWIPSVAMNLQGHAFMGLTRGGGSNAANTGQPSVGGAQRLASDALGTMTNLGTLVQGANYYLAQNTTGGQRWGDYSTTSVDPRDGMSIWSFQEYCNANNSWTVRAIKMLSAAPTASMTAAGITQGATTNVTINGTGFFNPGASYPDHLSINCGAGITVNSFTWTPTQIVANVTVAETAAVGTRNVTVTNPDGQSVTVTNGITVNQLVKNVSGSLTLSNFVGSSANLPFTLELRDATSNAVLQTVNLTGLGAGNTFAFTTTQLSGSYKLRVKAGKRFLGVVNNVTLSLSGASGLSYTLTNGDVDGNNTVNNTDYTIMRAAWGANSSSSNWNDGADLNGDGTVGNLDFAILRANLGLSGQ